MINQPQTVKVNHSLQNYNTNDCTIIIDDPSHSIISSDNLFVQYLKSLC